MISKEPTVFDLYFATIVAHRTQPGKSIADCAKEALEMLTIRDIMFKEDTNE